MALQNEILVGRYNRFLQRLLSMKAGPPAAALAGEIGAQIQLDDATTLENRFEMGWRSFAAVSSAAAVAAQLSGVKLRNPATSGVIAVIEKLYIFATATSTADNPRITRGPSPGSGDFSGPLTGVNRDARQPASGSTCAISQTTAGVFAGAQFATMGIGAGQGAFLDLMFYSNEEIVLREDDMVTVWAGAVNTQVNAGFFWRERALEEGERT